MPNKPCKFCKDTTPNHWPYQCRKNPKTKKKINQIGKIGRKHIQFKHDWIKENVTKEGTWECYLQIHENCPRILTLETLTLEHVEPKSGAPDRRFDKTNIKPACWWCNSKKGSKRLENVL